MRTGTDIVLVRRVEELLAGSGEAFLGRWFTPGEIAYCSTRAVPGRHYAARLAAKEAVVKALRPDWDGPVPFGCVEIVHDEHGAPEARLSGRLLEAAQAQGVRNVQVSLSHCDDYATAVALVELA
jgi:holo-[acyl-carrier protein] synthase